MEPGAEGEPAKFDTETLPPTVRIIEKMEKALELDKFISYLAMEVITWDWDGYPMNRNNYRIYHDPKRDKLVFIPSGMDQMYGNPGGPIMRRGSRRGHGRDCHQRVS